jgi:hypothetical protein
MNRSILAYATILVVSLGASWVHYTADTVAAPKEGVVLVDSQKDVLQSITYKAPDLEVVFEVRKDMVGSYGWVTVTETKKKKVDGQETSETITTRFKAGSAGDKLMESWAPLMALRELGKPDDAKIQTFGLTKVDTMISVVSNGKTWNLELGGETYGSKDRYVRDSGSGLVYVLKKDLLGDFKSAKTKLRDATIFSGTKDKLEYVKVGRGASTVRWTQKNIDDAAAAFWEREGTEGTKDTTFSNWLDKLLKVKSTEYVQGEEPTGLVPVMDLTLKTREKPEEQLQILRVGDDWYARGTFTRGLVKLNKATISEAEGEIDDVLEGKAPPEKPKAPEGAGIPPGMPPGMPGGPPGMPPGGPPGMSPERREVPLPPRPNPH